MKLTQVIEQAIRKTTWVNGEYIGPIAKQIEEAIVDSFANASEVVLTPADNQSPRIFAFVVRYAEGSISPKGIIGMRYLHADSMEEAKENFVKKLGNNFLACKEITLDEYIRSGNG